MSNTANLAVGAETTAAHPRVAADLGLAVADVCWPFFEHLIREIDGESVEVLRLKCMDYVNGWRIGQYPWSPGRRLRRTRPGAWDQQFVLPSGWMKRFPRVGMRPIARSLRAWWDRVSPRRRGLLMTYPHYLHLRDQARPDVSIYYNFDDYTLFWPAQADRVRAMERAMVRAADLTFCVSRLRAEELRAAVPEADFRIHHLPHGAPNAFLAPEPLARPAEPPEDIAHLPRPLLGYIGSMEDRVDWELMDRLSLTFPEASIVVVGRIRPPVDAPWWEASARFLARPNVHAIGWRPQEAIARYYQAFDVSLIPYRLDHPFNRACNPTKIMDAMGSGRPIVATAIPECRLHAARFHVAEDAETYLSMVGRILEDGSDDGRAGLRHAFAVEHSCRNVAARLIDLIEGRH